MSGTIEFDCPHCSKTIRTSSRYGGMQGPCPHCGKLVKVEASGGTEFRPVSARSAKIPRTDANPILAGMLGCIMTMLLYLGFVLFSRSYIGQLFTNRGVVPYVTTLVFCWGVAILLLKYLAVKQQLKTAEMDLELMPLKTGVQITPKNVESFLQHLEALPHKVKDSILGRRIYGALEHFRSRNSVPEVQSYLASHAQLDASSVDAGYTLLRSIIWAIPILGFIGTVVGISSAVTGLSQSLDTGDASPAATAEMPAAADKPAENLGEKMIGAMGLVTQGLATAFDTTFVALVMAILLLFPTEELKRTEYGMLDRIEAFTNESLLRRMSDESASKLSPEIARLLEPAFRKHQEWLLEWQDKVGNLGETIGGDFERFAVSVQQRLESVQIAQLSDLTHAIQSLLGVLPDLSRSVEQFHTASSAIAVQMQASVERAAELQAELARNTAAIATHVPLSGPIVSGAGDGFAHMEQVAESLSASVRQLTDQISQATVPTLMREDHSPRRSLFGFLRS